MFLLTNFHLFNLYEASVLNKFLNSLFKEIISGSTTDVTGAVTRNACSKILF